MRIESVESADPPEVAGPKKPINSFIISLDRSVSTHYEQELTHHEEAFIKHRSLRLPLESVTLSRDPRDFPFGEMWRDALRKAFKFEDLQVEFLWISASLKLVRRLFDWCDEEYHIPWQEVLAALNSADDENLFLPSRYAWLKMSSSSTSGRHWRCRQSSFSSYGCEGLELRLFGCCSGAQFNRKPRDGQLAGRRMQLCVEMSIKSGLSSDLFLSSAANFSFSPLVHTPNKLIPPPLLAPPLALA